MEYYVENITMFYEPVSLFQCKKNWKRAGGQVKLFQ